MKQYLNLLENIIEFGDPRVDRTGIGTKSIFGAQMRFDLTKSFPLLTTKKLHLPSIIHELLWFLTGDTNIKYLNDNNVRIWNEWADENGNLGPVYGYQWRHWDGKIDQITQVVNSIKTNPSSRRHIVSAWNVSDIDKMRLPPCHLLFQFYVSHGNKLSCQLYQRSCDAFLGLPFNIACYSLLTCMMAKVCNLLPGEFVWTGGDVHLYNNHLELAQMQLKRTPYDLCSLEIKDRNQDIFSFKYEDFIFDNYQAHPSIKAKVAV